MDYKKAIRCMVIALMAIVDCSGRNDSNNEMSKADSNAKNHQGQQQKPVNVNKRLTVCYDSRRNCFHYEKAVCTERFGYIGTRDYTLGGLKCHDWSLVGKHRKEGWPKNYCRNPDNSAGPWCFAGHGWDYCFAGCNNENCYDSSRDCFHYGKAGCLKMASYIGLRNHTINGARCQTWKSHGLAGNLSRDPFGGVKGPFCYTNSNTKEWNYCFKDCNAAKCFDSKRQCFHFGKKGCMEPYSYIGDKSTTKDGTKCQKWSSHNKDLPKNYCRKYYGSLNAPWCYTGPREGDWDYCFPDCKADCYDSRRNCFHYERAVCSHKDAYTGTRGYTLGGQKCHDWSSHGRHGYPKNYCRNSGKSIGPWCYADNGWDFCFTGCNNENCYDSSRDCFHYGKTGCLKMSSYIGPRNYSINRALCQPWKSHSHPLAGNLCRDPFGGLKGPFCYTNPNTDEWNYCFKDCNAAKCFDSKRQCFYFGEKGCMKPHSYIGDKDTIIDGTKCQKWSSHNIDLPNNYCRLHYGGLKSPWCYTGPGEGATDWSYCFSDCDSGTPLPGLKS